MSKLNLLLPTNSDKIVFTLLTMITTITSLMMWVNYSKHSEENMINFFEFIFLFIFVQLIVSFIAKLKSYSIKAYLAGIISYLICIAILWDDNFSSTDGIDVTFYSLFLTPIQFAGYLMVIYVITVIVDFARKMLIKLKGKIKSRRSV